MEKLNKAKLAKQTKEELARLGKVYSLTLKATLSKDEMMAAILKADKKAAPAKNGVVAKKTVTAGKSGSKAPAAKKSAAKAAASEKAEVISAPKAAAPIKTKSIATNAARPVSPPSPKAGLAANFSSAKVKTTVSPSPKYRAGEEEVVEESKYHVAQTQEHLEAATIPDRYEDNRIVLLARDPYWGHTFWDLHPNLPADTAARNGTNLGECHFALRVYDVTDVSFNGRNAHKHFDIGVHGLKNSWYVNVPEEDRAWVAEIGLKSRKGEFFMMARSNVIMMGRGSVSNRTDEDWMIADDDFWKMYALSGGFQARGSSMSIDMQEQMRQRLSGETSSGAVSSFAGSPTRPTRKPDQFWFRLDCELIVYGATEPDANVTLAGQTMQLRPDGTFTARFALPDGIQIIEAKAVSANRRFEKTITPTVSRGTTVLQNRPELKEETEE
ncbi:MAG: DUF4912 domain-containing protein [Nitrospinae bacterium]|nr:DUF4912 domain-containing protein [Nitrospinota bacterium]